MTKDSKAESTPSKTTPVNKRAGLEKDIAVGVLLAVVVCVIGFFVSAHFVNISRDATAAVNEGRELLGPAGLLHDRALLGMIVSFLALIGIGVLYVLRNKLPHTLTVMALFVLLTLIVVAFAANTFQTYRGFGSF